MAHIAFAAYPEFGHVLPTIQLGRALVSLGHSVRYISCELSKHEVSQVAHFVESCGLPFLEQSLTEDTKHGSISTASQPSTGDSGRRWPVSFRAAFASRKASFEAMSLGLSERLEWVRRQLVREAPDLVLVDELVSLVGIVAHNESIPVLLYGTSFPSHFHASVPPYTSSFAPTGSLGSRALVRLFWKKLTVSRALESTLNRLLQLPDIDIEITAQASRLAAKRSVAIEWRTSSWPRARFPGLVLAPRELEWPQRRESQLFYVGPSVDLTRPESEFDETRLNQDLPLVFVSLGSQVARTRHARQFFRTAISSLDLLPGWQMVLCTGPRIDPETLPKARNLIVEQTVPQLRLLQRADLMLTHGGLGSVKECILSGVPMIVFPTQYDQASNGARVSHYRLGCVRSLEIGAAELAKTILEVHGDPRIRTAVKRQQAAFQRQNNANAAVRMVEAELRRRG